MHRLRKLTVIAAMAGGLLGRARPTPRSPRRPTTPSAPTPTTTSPCARSRTGSTMCKDSNGKDIDCPQPKVRLRLGATAAG